VVQQHLQPTGHLDADCTIDGGLGLVIGETLLHNRKMTVFESLGTKVTGVGL